VAVSVEARPQWGQLPIAARAVVERTLGEVAKTVGLRQWVSDEEAQESFDLQAADHVVTYRLDPQTRALLVTGLSPPRRGGEGAPQ
jgi:hypothetical protein